VQDIFMMRTCSAAGLLGFPADLLLAGGGLPATFRPPDSIQLTGGNTLGGALVCRCHEIFNVLGPDAPHAGRRLGWREVPRFAAVP
jgi:hypothetical protein